MVDPCSHDRLSDRAEIQDVMFRWCRAVDRLDCDGIRGVFHPDAFDSHGPGHFEGGVEELIEWIRWRHMTIPFCLHSLSNMLIEFVGTNAAIVETNIMAAQHYPKVGDPVIKLLGGGRPGMAMDMLAFARYADRFERRNGEWRIQRRVVIMDSQMLLEAGASTNASGITLGRRNQEDFIYKMRAEAGL